MRIDNEAEQLSIYDLDLWCGRMFQEPSPAEPQKERISGSSLRRSSELKSVVFQSLDLTPGAGNLLGEFYWELISPWRGDASTLNTGVSPREEKESSLSQILQDDPPDKYYLTRKACLGILRRAFERGKELPRKLNRALEIQSGVAPPDGRSTPLEAYHINQRDEGIDLHGVSGALMATNNMQMQTFVTQPDDAEIEGFDGYNGDLTGSVAATLGVNCGMSTGRNGLIQPIAFAANQRDEVRDLHDVAGALGAQPGMKQQTFIAEGVVAKGNGDCFLTPERHTSLSAGGGQAGQGHVTENGSSDYILAEENLELLRVACRLRSYIRKPPGEAPHRFVETLPRTQRISQEEFNSYVSERLDNTGRVVGAYDIDLDSGDMEAVNIMDGWKRFRIRDVSTAAYFAMKKGNAAPDERWRIFLDRLEERTLNQEPEPEYLTGSRRLCAEDISFAEDIVQNDNLLEFYMEVSFNADQVFGTDVCTSENDDWLNIYANYDLDARRVCDTLEVYLQRGNGDEEAFKYRLSAEEQALLFPR